MCTRKVALIVVGSSQHVLQWRTLKMRHWGRTCYYSMMLACVFAAALLLAKVVHAYQEWHTGALQVTVLLAALTASFDC